MLQQKVSLEQEVQELQQKYSQRTAWVALGSLG